ncbi:MAG TPA: hypothetical protein VGZ71_03810, partial [Puia sp.]|nr:hypothetical protein [Puia sp.]
MGLLLLFTSCHSRNGRIEKVWFYVYSSDSSADRDTTLTPASFINLQKDGSYTKDFGRFEFGKWVLKDKLLQLTDYKNETSNLSFNYTGDNMIQIGLPNRALNNFESMSVANGSQNPFSKDNNLWRIPASKKESDAELKGRLLNHFKFWETYFNWALDNELNTIDVRSTPTLLKIYGNGFALKSYDQLPKEWKLIFYDEEDCQKANDQLKYFIENNTIGWPHTENKYKMFISAFQQ